MPKPRTRLWFNPCFGASGDMILGALLGLSTNPDPLAALVASDIGAVGVDGWSLSLEETTRASLSATKAVVEAQSGPAHRRWSMIDQMLASSPLPDPVAKGARATFLALGTAEAAVHNTTIDEVHFHEVGAVDAIVDIVGAWSAIHHLGQEFDLVSIRSAPVGVGYGTVQAAHGLLPVPAPATVDLLSGIPIVEVPGETKDSRGAGETITPTGAAILSQMVEVWGGPGNGTVRRSSRGAGNRDPGHYPNVLAAMIVEISKGPK